MPSNSRGEFPYTFVLGSEGMGSFDCVAASLRETATPLRMTIYWELTELQLLTADLLRAFSQGCNLMGKT